MKLTLQKQIIEKDAQKKISRHLRLGHLNFEKCDLLESNQSFLKAYELAKKTNQTHLASEALAGLLVCAGENLDFEKLKEYKKTAHELLTNEKNSSFLLWYCIGAADYRLGLFQEAQKSLFRFLKFLRKNEIQTVRPTKSPLAVKESVLWRARTFLMLSVIAQSKGKIIRAQSIAQSVLKHYENEKLPGINGLCHLILGFLSQTKKEFTLSISYFQKAQIYFLGEHHWYYYLYVLVGHASVSRQQGKFKQAYWYLDLVEKATDRGGSFGAIKALILRERTRLEKTSVDLVIDAKKGTVKRGNKIISLRKQHVLFNLLKVLFFAKNSKSPSKDGSVSKSLIIEKVWKDRYYPEAHDNKLYYNINRLRKLIENDYKNPEIILNSRDGYRFAPGLKIKFFGEDDTFSFEEEQEGDRYV